MSDKDKGQDSKSFINKALNREVVLNPMPTPQTPPPNFTSTAGVQVDTGGSTPSPQASADTDTRESEPSDPSSSSDD